MLVPQETRTISVDFGLLTAEELLKNHKGERRRSLEHQIKHASLTANLKRKNRAKNFKEGVRWFLDNAHLTISVSAKQFFHRVEHFALNFILII